MKNYSDIENDVKNTLNTDWKKGANNVFSADWKKNAYKALIANWQPAVLATLMVLVVNAIIMGLNYWGIYSLAVVSSLLILCVMVPLVFIYRVAMLDFSNGNADKTVNNMIDIFKAKYVRYLCVSLLTSLFIYLWSLLLVIPGIIKAYAYAMTPYIAAENPELGPDECIECSMRMMYGHKWELFVLDISFIGWWILCAVTCGIATLFVAPYMQLSHAEFYKDLKKAEA